MQTKATLKKELVRLVREFNQKGWSPATSTNYSFRNPSEKSISISVSGIDKSQFSEEHIMEIDAKGNPLPDFAHLKSSAETLLHTLLYEKPEIGAVLHTHSLYATILSRFYQKQEGISLQGYEVLKGLQGVTTHQTNIWLPIFENSQNMPALSDEIRSYWESSPKMQGFLLASHGLYTWGKDLKEAKRHLEVWEFLMECTYKFQQLQS